MSTSDFVNRAVLLRAAKATISCAHFKAGETVPIQFEGIHGGRGWFLIHETERGKLEYPVAYPENHLTEFSR